MKLMIAKKQSAPVAIACIIAATSTAALANNLGSPGSALDPNNYVAPPVSKTTIKAPRLDNAAGEPQEETQSTTTFVTMPGFESPGEKPEKSAQKTGKVKAAPSADDGNGLLSGVNDKFKSAGSGIASSTKAAGDSVKKGTKAVGGGIASGAKASSSFFIKGARAIGSGTKKMGSKVAQGAKAAGDTVKDGTHAVADKLPFTGKSGKEEQPKAVADAKPSEDLKQEPVAQAKQEDLKTAEAAPTAPAKVAATPKTPKNMILKTEDTTNKPSIVGKTLGTFGKLNVFHKKNQAAPVAPVGVATAPSSADKLH